jgi:TRAP-type C4-dicarboxylate transport system permease small subunit
MRAFDRLVDGLVRGTDFVVIGISYFFVILLPTSVVLRYVFNYGFEWVDELSSILVATVMFAALAVCFAENMHIRIDALLDALPPPVRRVTLLCSHAITAAFFGVVGYFGYFVAVADLGISMSTLPLQRGIFLFVIPLASGIAALCELRNLAHTLQGDLGPRRSELDEMRS